MKKLLLLFIIAFASNLNAQDYWTEYPTGQVASTGQRSISIVDDNVVWLSNSCGTTGCTTIRRYTRSVNGGTIWNTGVVDLGPSSANLEIGNIHGVSATVAYASVFPKAATAIGGIWKTIDAGVTWTRQPTAVYGSADSFANIVYFWDANNGVTMGDPDGGYFEIYTTTNGGTTWTRTPSSNIPAPLTPGPEYGLTNKFNVTGDVIWIGTTSGRILKSVDKGYNWTISQSPITDFGGGLNGSGSGDMAFTDSMNGLLLSNDYSIYNTSDGGETWSPLAYSSDNGIGNFAITNVPGMPGYYINCGTDVVTDPVRGSYYSIDNGLNWSAINDNPDTNYVDGGVLAFSSSTMGFASGFSTSAAVGGIFKWNGNTLLANTQFSTDKKFTISPNPTTGRFIVAGANITQVQVIDVLGKVIINNNYSSLSSIDINLENTNSGIYMVKITNDAGNTSVMKVIKQ